MVIEKQDNFLINCDNISLSKRNRHIISDISFSVYEKEIVTIIGHNGAGKSTIAKLLLGLSYPCCGKIFTAPDLTISYVPQNLHFSEIFPITVDKFLNLPTKVDEKLLAKIEEKTKISYLRDQQVHTLSGGEKQRVLLTRAISRNPKLLILDEPIQNIDSQGQTELYQLLKWVRDELGIAILLISHDLVMLSNISDKIIHIQDGKIIFKGTAHDFSQSCLICPAPSVHKQIN